MVFVNDTETTEIYTLSLHDALPICEQSIDTAGNTHRFVGIPRQSRNDVPVGIEVHISARVNGCFLAMVVDDLSPIGKADHHEPAATKIASRWVSHGQGKRRGDRGINCVAPLFQDC